MTSFFLRDVMTGYVVLHVLVVLCILTGVESCDGKTCADCIASGAECAWCADANFTSRVDERCGREAVLRNGGCMDIQNPKTEEDLSGRKDEEVTDGNSEEGSDAIQLQPQAMRIKLRPRGKGHDFYVTFRPANNFPVDLYFLFDLSSTMKIYINDFANVARQIAQEIGKISKNYRMGYGTFQDKVLLPFTSTHPIKLQNPCPKNNDCAPPFDFRHEMRLTKDIISFTAAVDKSTNKTTGNIDRPEGGFDAMMQAIVCQKVGWRDNSRQLIIMASDARMHFAGDGKLAGLITPNDGSCHLEDGYTNSMAKKQDYPSVGQISEALDRSKKHVIFAVVGKVVEEYQKLQNHVPRSTVNVLKGGKDSNVVDIVRDKYQEMTKGVKLQADPSSSNIKVTIEPTCESREGSSCTDLVIGQKVNPFKVNIRAVECPKDPKDRIQHVLIAPTDFLKDTLNVTVEILCDCGCELEQDQMVPSERCSQGNGTEECGICRCFEGRSGSLCECGQQEHESAGIGGSCSMDGGNSTQGPECSGLGQCVCGVCQCQPNYSGQYCQCNDKVCPVFDGLVCGGNGECRCEVCHCYGNFTGRACDCPTSMEACITTTKEGEEQVCSGHGSCQCGQCTCEKGYLGQYCQTCFLCGDSVCEDETYNYRQCAVCAVTEGETCPDDCPEVIEVDEVDTDEQYTEHIEVCRDWLTEDCHIRFSVHNPGMQNTTLHVQRAQVCTEGPDILLIVLGVVGGVLFVGILLLLLVKLLTTFFDRLEYQHFVKELQAPKWAKHNNPIYKEATTTYYNPVMNRE